MCFCESSTFALEKTRGIWWPGRLSSSLQVDLAPLHLLVEAVKCVREIVHHLQAPLFFSLQSKPLQWSDLT